jgi:hypothetical protein
MGLFDLPTTEWECVNPDCEVKGKCFAEGLPIPRCRYCGAEMKMKENKQ